METQAAPSTTTPTHVRPPRGIFYQLSVVLGVAVVLATLFTAWTPGTPSPFPTEEGLASNPLPQPTDTPLNAPTATPRLRPLIGIVVGHWGDNNDPGSVCADGSTTEFTVNQNIATQVMKNLTASGYDVEMLKEFDPRLTGFVASALVSIHADSCEYINDQATGFKVASAMASPHPERAARLTSCLRARYSQSTGLPLHSTSVTNDMTSYHAFGEINESTTAAIIETGFLNLDGPFLTQNPDLAAKGISDGILCFINNEDVSSPASGQPAPTAPAGTQHADGPSAQTPTTAP